MILVILRGVFLLLAAAVASLYLLPYQQQKQLGFLQVVLMLGGTLALAVIIVTVDSTTRRKRLSAMSGVFLGLIAGLLAAYALSFVVDLVGVLTKPQDPVEATAYMNFLSGVKVVIGLITCYLGISMVLQTKDDFRFVIPYVEFAKQFRGNRPTLLDTSAIVDGRILDIVHTHILQGTLVVPRFVLEELQTIADSADKLRRTRGRRGLEILQKLQEVKNIDVNIQDHDPEGAGVDQKLINLARSMPARIMTGDFNLSKIASLRGLAVINLNDLATALRPVVLPGEYMTVALVKAGEGPAQGVGYLDDGTMIVVEGGREHLHELVNLVVTSTLQTSAGRMVFGKFDGLSDTASTTSESGEPSHRAASSDSNIGPMHQLPDDTSDQTEAIGVEPLRAMTPRPAARTSGRNPRRAR